MRQEIIRGNTYNICFQTDTILSGMYLMAIITNKSEQILFKASTLDNTIQQIGENAYVTTLTADKTEKMTGVGVFEVKLYATDNKEVIIAKNTIELSFINNVIHKIK